MVWIAAHQQAPVAAAAWSAHAAVVQLPHPEGYADFELLDQGLGIHINHAVDMHPVGQETKVRLVNAQHVLHRLAGDADLLADDGFALNTSSRSS